MCKPEAVSCGGGGGTYNSWRLTHSLLVTWEKKREKCLVLHVHVYNIIGLTSTLFFFSFFLAPTQKHITRSSKLCDNQLLRTCFSFSSTRCSCPNCSLGWPTLATTTLCAQRSFYISCVWNLFLVVLWLLCFSVCWFIFVCVCPPRIRLCRRNWSSVAERNPPALMQQVRQLHSSSIRLI
jgi:hypothetical protein